MRSYLIAIACLMVLTGILIGLCNWLFTPTLTHPSPFPFSQKKVAPQCGPKLSFSNGDPYTIKATTCEEAIILFLFKYYPDLSINESCPFFLSLPDNRQPSQELITSLMKVHKDIKVAKERNYRLGHTELRDASTIEKGIVFVIQEIQWRNTTDAVVVCGYWAGNAEGASSTHLVHNQNGYWLIYPPETWWVRRGCGLIAKDG
jgi:hypothetical protein